MCFLFFGKIPYIFFYFVSLKNIFAACESVELCLKQNTHCKVSISTQVVPHEWQLFKNISGSRFTTHFY